MKTSDMLKGVIDANGELHLPADQVAVLLRMIDCDERMIAGTKILFDELKEIVRIIPDVPKANLPRAQTTVPGTPGDT